MSGARTLQRGLQVLAVITGAHHALSATEIARSTGLDRAVIGRLLPPLVEAGFVDAQGSPPRYAASNIRDASVTDGGPLVGTLHPDIVEFLASDLEADDDEVWTGFDDFGPTGPHFETATIDDAYFAFMSFVGRTPMAHIADWLFGGEVPVSFVNRMGGVGIDDLGPDSTSIIDRMCDIDPAAAFGVFLAGLSERDLDILRDRLRADPETLEALADRHGLTRERVRQIVKKLRRSFAETLESNALIIERTAFARDAIGGIVDMRGLLATLFDALPMIDYLVEELHEPFFFLLFPEGSFVRHGEKSPWFVDQVTRRELSDVHSRALADGMPTDEFLDAVPALRAVDDVPALLAAMGLQESDGEVTARNLSMNERAFRLLRRAGTPIGFDAITDSLQVGGSRRGLRNALLADDRIVRIDREMFALAEWGLETYSTIRDLMRQELQALGGEARIADIRDRLTARFDVKASSIDVYANSPEFVRSSPGVIRLRGEHEELEDLERPLHSLRGCVRIGRRWALRVEVTTSLLRGFSLLLPTGMGPHFGVPQGQSATLPTDRSGEISIVRRGIQDNIGRLRWVAQEMGLDAGDVLFVRLPEREGGRISFSGLARSVIERADARRRAGLLLGQESDLTLALACSALGMPRGSRPAEVVDRLRSRGEQELAALVAEVLGEGSTESIDTRDIARMLGL
jgi:predicted transcriptional regulator